VSEGNNLARRLGHDRARGFRGLDCSALKSGWQQFLPRLRQRLAPADAGPQRYALITAFVPTTVSATFRAAPITLQYQQVEARQLESPRGAGGYASTQNTAEEVVS
jgi:hypothetical protein